MEITPPEPQQPLQQQPVEERSMAKAPLEIIATARESIDLTVKMVAKLWHLLLPLLLANICIAYLAKGAQGQVSQSLNVLVLALVLQLLTGFISIVLIDAGYRLSLNQAIDIKKSFSNVIKHILTLAGASLLVLVIGIVVMFLSGILIVSVIVPVLSSISPLLASITLSILMLLLGCVLYASFLFFAPLILFKDMKAIEAIQSSITLGLNYWKSIPMIAILVFFTLMIFFLLLSGLLSLLNLSLLLVPITGIQFMVSMCLGIAIMLTIYNKIVD